MAQKAYFLMPNFDCPPDSVIKLGQIISSAKAPNESIAEPLTPISQVLHSEKYEWGSEVSRSQKVSGGVFAQFLAQILGAGADFTYTWGRGESCRVDAATLEADFFDPNDEYVAQSLARDSVQDYIKTNPKTSIFMVTGIKVARGARMTQISTKTDGVSLSLEADATMFSGAPVSGGPKLSYGKSKQNRDWFGDSSDFVYAYKLNRIIIARRTGKLNMKSFTRGAQVHGMDDESADQKDSEAQVGETSNTQEVESVRLEKIDYGANGILPDKFELVEASDEHGGTCYVIT